MNKRFIEYYDSSIGNVGFRKPAIYSPPELNNHYEKVKVKEPFYFYVNQKEPSDIEGA